MGARDIAIVAAIVGGLGWLTKIVVMALQGGPDSESVPEAAAFFTGLVGVMVAAGAAGAHVTRGASWWRRALAAVGAVVVVGVLGGLGQAGLTALPGDSWVQEEAIFGIAGLVSVLAALAALRRPDRPSGVQATPP